MRPFIPFGFSHWAVLLLTVLLSLLLAGLSRRYATARGERIIRYGLAALLIADWAGLLLTFAAHGWIGIGTILPMELCDWATIACIVALIWPQPLPYALAYFWALGGTLQALLGPGMVYDFPDAEFIVYFSFHALIMIAVLYLTLGIGLRPTPAILPRVILWSLVYMASAGATNWLLGTNYGFLRAKPTHPTLYDLMPDWPWYLPVVACVGLISIAIYYAPFFFIDVLKKPEARNS